MPIIPKIQMPYYNIDENLPIPGGKTRIYSNTERISTDGENATSLYLFDIPANAIKNPGDGVEINYYWENNYDSGGGHVYTYIDMDGVTVYTIDELSLTNKHVTLKITRVDEETIYTVIEQYGFTNFGWDIKTQYANTAIQIRFSGHCVGNASVITTNYVTADLNLK